MTLSSEKREMCYPTNDTLRVGEFGLKRLNHPAVLILVVMEDTLRVLIFLKQDIAYDNESLNPCCNGRYSQRK